MQLLITKTSAIPDRESGVVFKHVIVLVKGWLFL